MNAGPPLQSVVFTATCLFLTPAAMAQGTVPYPVAADWTSTPDGVATGGAFADLDGDGYLDVVVANGNDISRQKVEVYTNDGAGDFPTDPQWSSTDVDYHGHLDVGDVNRDGLLDVAVSVFLGPGGFGDPGRVKLYTNVSGTLESSPSWSSTDGFATFSCDLGDADSDGDLDLAVATGEPYFGSPDKNRIYYGSSGTLAGLPAWSSLASDHALDVAFGDADGDGDLDLAFATAGSATTVFYQGAGGLGTSPGWSATDNTDPFNNTIAWRDVDGDGHRELAVSDNDQILSGSGDFKLYQNTAGTLATTPYWSDFGGQVSAIALADVTLDGLPDLCGGVWFGGSQIYRNEAGGFPSAPQWSSSVDGTVEALFFGDVDRRGMRKGSQSFAPNGRTYYLGHAPAHEVLGVWVDGSPVGLTAYCSDLEDGWISLGQTPTIDLRVDYRWSLSLDLGVTNWDQTVGNQVYLRPHAPKGSRAPRAAGGLPTATRTVPGAD